VEGIANYYELLGVAPDAPTPAIRDAYRRAARLHHPDRAGERSAARMAEINRAWQVLGDAARRSEYDLSLREPVITSAAPSPSTPPPAPTYVEPKFNPLARYQDPPRFPWRFMGVLAALGILLVVISVATAPDPVPPTVDRVLRPGDCVVIRPNGDAAEVLCTEQHDGVVEVLVTAGDPCPATAEPHRDELGLGTACVRPL
jgi:hypothetical protein